MPCGDYPDDKYSLRQDNRELQDEVSKLKRLLCQACHAMENSTDDRMYHILNTLVVQSEGTDFTELAEWWEEHQKEDKERIERERQEAERQREMSEAVAKLTPRERDLLGIKYRG